MPRVLALAIVVGVCGSGCLLLDPNAGKGPARFFAGPNARSVMAPGAPKPNASPTTFAGSTPAPEASSTQLSAVTASFQFTMRARLGYYAGIEAEAGRLDENGSNFGGAYAIVGGEHASSFGSIGVELASGWRGLRYGFGDEQDDRLVFEPRVRGQIWIADQWTVGGAAGALLGGGGQWMAGVYIGVHSHRF